MDDTSKFFLLLLRTCAHQYVYIIDPSARSRWLDIGRVLFLRFYGPRLRLEVHKHAKRERGQYLAILTELAWSIKGLLYGINRHRQKNDFRTCLFSSTETTGNQICA